MVDGVCVRVSSKRELHSGHVGHRHHIPYKGSSCHTWISHSNARERDRFCGGFHFLVYVQRRACPTLNLSGISGAQVSIHGYCVHKRSGFCVHFAETAGLFVELHTFSLPFLFFLSFSSFKKINWNFHSVPLTSMIYPIVLGSL